MGRPDRIYFVEAARGPHGGPYFDLDEALFAGLASASAAGRAVRVVGVPVDFCETIAPPTDMPASVSEVRRVREAGSQPAALGCGATATYAAPGVAGAGVHVKCDRTPGHDGPHGGTASSGQYWQWP